MKANIEYNLLLQNNGYALIETKGNYIVAANYNQEAPFGQQWTNGTYYTFFGNTEVKPKMLAAALECYRLRTESGYISRLRPEGTGNDGFSDGANSIEEEQTNMGKIQEYEYTPTQMAEKLLEFNRDFSDSAEDIQNEKEYVAELFEKLQNSNEFNILAHYLDTMFMDEVFNK